MQDDVQGSVQDDVRDDGRAGVPDDALADTSTGPGEGTSLACRPRWTPGRVRSLPLWLAAVAALTVATAWPWLLLFGWLHRGGTYAWGVLPGCLLVTALAWLRFVDERALRAVRHLRAPHPSRERELADALEAAGAPASVVWTGALDGDDPVCLAAHGRRHVVFPTGSAVGDAELARRAAADLATGRPWVRPVASLARVAWRGPFSLGFLVLVRRLGWLPSWMSRQGTLGGVDVRRAVDPVTTAVAFFAAGPAGYASTGALAALRGEGARVSLDAEMPWGTVGAYGGLAALMCMVLVVWPYRWAPVPVDGATSRGKAPRWRGTNDLREARRNHAVVAGRRSLAFVFGGFASWFVASLWTLWAPLGLAERFGWLAEATPAFRAAYLVVALPGTALGVVTFLAGWDLVRVGRRPVLLAGGVYLLASVGTPALVRALAAAGVVDDTSGTALVTACAVVGVLLVVVLAGLARALLSRRATGTS